MGGKTKEKKPKEEQRPKIVPTKAERPEFTQVVDIRDPWEGKQKIKIKMPTKKEISGEVDLEKEEFATRESFAEKLAELRARMERRERKDSRYHRGNVAYRPRGTKKKKRTYLDRMSRLGSVAGNRTGAKKKKAGKEGENVMVFTPKELYGKKEAEQLAKLDAERRKKPKKKKGS